MHASSYTSLICKSSYIYVPFPAVVVVAVVVSVSIVLSVNNADLSYKAVRCPNATPSAATDTVPMATSVYIST